jgi:uncharacterized protein YkwD
MQTLPNGDESMAAQGEEGVTMRIPRTNSGRRRGPGIGTLEGVTIGTLAFFLAGLASFGELCSWNIRPDSMAVGKPAASVDPLITELVKAHNNARAEAKLPALELDAKLVEAAQLHARDMSEHQKMSHQGSDGSTPAERVKRQSFHSLRTAENIASGQRTVEAVVKTWLNSPGHKRNILGDFSRIGAAKSTDKQGEPYWCAVFGTPMPRLAPDQAAAEVVDRINQARKEAGQRTLTVEARLGRIAQAAASAMARENTLKVSDRQQTGLVDQLEKEGLNLHGLSQSIASGHPTPADLLHSLWADEGQKKRLMGPYSLIGVGYANAEADHPYWCIILGEP